VAGRDRLKPGRLVLVEGTSDRIALETLAERLDLEGPEIVVLGGAHAIANYVPLAPRDAQLAGLCDKNEEPVFRRYLEEVYVCEPDLEGELIRALGTDRALALVDPSFATLQKQPEYRDQPLETQLRRYLSGRSGNKLRYARLFAEALDLDTIPAPLQGVIAYR
jgi:hypothetical protein